MKKQIINPCENCKRKPNCPIASYGVDGGIVGGVYTYDTAEEAIAAWNRRVNDGEA